MQCGHRTCGAIRHHYSLLITHYQYIMHYGMQWARRTATRNSWREFRARAVPVCDDDVCYNILWTAITAITVCKYNSGNSWFSGKGMLWKCIWMCIHWIATSPRMLKKFMKIRGLTSEDAKERWKNKVIMKDTRSPKFGCKKKVSENVWCCCI